MCFRYHDQFVTACIFYHKSIDFVNCFSGVFKKIYKIFVEYLKSRKKSAFNGIKAQKRTFFFVHNFFLVLPERKKSD